MQAFWALLQLPLHTVYIAHISKHGGDGDVGCGDGDDGDIPHICQFWYTTTLSSPVESTPKSTQIPDVIAKIGQNGPK